MKSTYSKRIITRSAAFLWWWSCSAVAMATAGLSAFSLFIFFFNMESSIPLGFADFCDIFFFSFYFPTIGRQSFRSIRSIFGRIRSSFDWRIVDWSVLYFHFFGFFWSIFGNRQSQGRPRLEKNPVKLGKIQ